MENVICQLEELKTKYSELENKTSELEDKNSELKEKNSELEDKNSDLKEKNSELAKLVAYYEEYFRLNQHHQFGPSSEKADSDSRQVFLVFDEVENDATASSLYSVQRLANRYRKIMSRSYIYQLFCKA